MPTLLIIIRDSCGKHCELLLNRFLIKDLHHILNLLRHLPLSSIIDDKIGPPPTSFSTPCEKRFRPPTSSLDPPIYKKSRPPHLHFDNSNSGYLMTFFSNKSVTVRHFRNPKASSVTKVNTVLGGVACGWLS